MLFFAGLIWEIAIAKRINGKTTYNADFLL